MKKQFLLGLMAMLLPWTVWAADETTLKDDVLEVTLKSDSFQEGTTTTYNGTAVEVTPTVTYYFKQGNTQKSEELQPSDYEISYTWESFVPEEEIVENVTDFKKAGTYTVTVTGTSEAYKDYIATASFTINRASLTLTDQIVKKGARIQYGTTDEELQNLDINNYITLTTESNGLVDDEDLADALNCLSLTFGASTDEEGATGATLLKVVANTPNGSTNYEYKGDGVYVKVDIDKRILTLSLNQKTRPYDGETTTAENLVDGLDFVQKDLTANAVSATYTVTKKDSEETDIKNAGEYTIVVSLTGPAKDNYEFANKKDEEEEVELTYTITRKVINIITKENAVLSKVYDGNVVSKEEVEKFYDIDSAVNGDNITVTMQPSGATKTVVDAGENVVTIAPYVNGHQIQSKNWSAPETDWDAPEVLGNYAITIDGKSTSSALPKFTITKRHVLFYFAGKDKNYQKTGITNETLKDYYTVEVLEQEGTGFVTIGETTHNFKAAPVAKFAGEVTEAKAIAAYDLTWDTDQKVTYSDDKENYEAIFVDAENAEYGGLLDGKTNANVFKITKRELTITALNTTIPYGADLSTLDEYLKISADKVQAEGKTVEGANIERGLVAESKDFDAILKKLGETLVIDKENVDLTTVGTNKGVIKFTVEDSDLADDETYNIHLVAGDLIVEGKDAITLDALAEEGDEDEVSSQVSAYNGQEVKSVTIKNLRNFVNATNNTFEENAIIKADQWYSLVLPFDITVRELSGLFGYAVVNVPNTDNNKDDIYFKLTVGTVPANTLMAFKVDKTMLWVEEGTEVDDENGEYEVIKGIEFKEKTIVAPDVEYSVENGNRDVYGNMFHAVYEKKQLTKDTEWFLFISGKFYSPANIYVPDVVDIYPLNGYVESVSSNARIFMEDADGTITAISAVTGETIYNAAEGWYTIGGVKLNGEPTQKGVYINNGVKVVIK